MKKIISILCLILLSSCVTRPFVTTPLQEKLNDNKEEILKASRILIGKVDSIMESQTTLSPDMKEALELLKKAQAALGVSEKEKQVLNDLQGPKLSDYVDNLNNKIIKLQEVNEDLSKKINHQNNDNAVSKIGSDAVDKDHAETRYKWYAIFGCLTVIGGLILYYIPSSFSKLILGGIGVIFQKSKNNDNQ